MEKLNPQQFPEATTLEEWIEEERQKGLIDVKFFKKDIASSTVESFCAEVNQMLRSPIVAHHDLF